MRAAVEVAIERLPTRRAVFLQKAGCISCHHQSLPAVAVTLADAKGAKTDRVLASHPTQATLAVWSRSREQMLLGNCAVFGFLGNVTYGLFGLAEEGVAPSAVTDAVTSCLSGLQKPDAVGRVPTRGHRVRQEPIVYTAPGVARGRDVIPAPGRREDTAARTRARASEFIRRARPDDTQDALQTARPGLGGAPTSEISMQADRVRARQRQDGGWSQLSTMQSDAYATGQALHALRASGLAATNATYRRGVEYLLRTQLQDGTWYVRSRAIGFQPYVDTGSRTDQTINLAPPWWAVMPVLTL